MKLMKRWTKWHRIREFETWPPLRELLIIMVLPIEWNKSCISKVIHLKGNVKKSLVSPHHFKIPSKRKLSFALQNLDLYFVLICRGPWVFMHHSEKGFSGNMTIEESKLSSPWIPTQWWIFNYSKTNFTYLTLL